jgi:hypothetical protein
MRDPIIGPRKANLSPPDSGKYVWDNNGNKAEKPTNDPKDITYSVVMM